MSLQLSGECFLRQELNDWTAPFLSKGGAEGDDQRQEVKDSVLADMKRLFATEAAAERAQAASTKKTKASVQAPRIPNGQLVERLDNAFRNGLGWGLSHFLPKNQLHCLERGERRYMVEVIGKDGSSSLRSCISAEDGSRRFESPQVRVGGARHHSVVHICCDMGAIGFPRASWLCHKVGLKATLIFDVLHRRTCDWDEAIAEAGLRLLALETKQLLKLRQGPFHSAAYHSVIVQAAQEMFDITTWEDNLIYHVLYASIAADFSMRSSELGSDDHMKAVWFKMREALLAPSKGDNTKSGRWWCYEENSRRFFGCKYSLLCVLCWVGFRRGWWRNFSDFPLNGSLSECPGQGDNINEKGLESLGDEIGEGDQAEAGNQDAPLARMSETTARAEASKRRSACVNSLHFGAKVLSNQFHMRLWSAVALLPTMVQDIFDQWMTDLKTLRGIEHVLESLVLGRDTDVLRRIFHRLVDADFSVDLGFRREARTTFEGNEDARVAACLWRLAVTFVGEAALTNLFFETPPQFLIAVLSRDEGTRKDQRDKMKSYWEALEVLELHAAEYAEARTWLHNLMWPLQQWTREMSQRHRGAK